MMGMKIKKFKRSSAFFMAAALCLGSTSGVYAMDESELSRIIEEAKNTDTSRYTPESCESLQAALEGAENLLSREDVTEEELTAILQKIKANLDQEIEQKRNVNLLRENYIKSLPILREQFLNELVMVLNYLKATLGHVQNVFLLLIPHFQPVRSKG